MKTYRLTDPVLRSWLAQNLAALRCQIVPLRWKRYDELLRLALTRGRKFVESVVGYIGDIHLEKIAGDLDGDDSLRHALESWGLVDEASNDCPTCQGTGIGQSGDPDTSRCRACSGRGHGRSQRDQDMDDNNEGGDW